MADGILRASRHLTDDRELPVFFVKRGDDFGFLPLLDGGRCPLTVVASTPARVYVLERRFFQEFLRENPEFCRHLLAALAAELPHDAPNGTITGWPMRQSQLAEALGIAPENLSRAVAKLERLGILCRQSRHHLRVDDPTRLRAAAERSLPELDDRQ